ncbi:uncharacterized protein LOC133800306 [Humulus lupulus]|uniref:uncharacterized protein LOC133800306 n=1 Tax=Humulus lupulus TaxID=3486 RepID=UPI002B4149EC|nr:uncharacterized protein LOC133800306 [Humulus lupulus]
MEDIEEEIAFWNSAMVCYVLGANPPLGVFEGFVKRMWKEQVDRVGLINHGIFIVRFHNVEKRDEVISGGFMFFDKKPIIMKPWVASIDFKKENVEKAPIWIQLKGLDLKYWGEKALFKIISQIGNPVMVDQITLRKERLNFPRVMVEVHLKQEFPELIYFINERDEEVFVFVEYEWKPTLCRNCQGLGHETGICRKQSTQKQAWVVKQNPEKDTKENSKKIQDEEGFQEVQKGWRVRIQEETVISIGNNFQILRKQGNADGNKDKSADRHKIGLVTHFI